MAVDYPVAREQDHPPQRVDVRAAGRKSARAVPRIYAFLPMFCLGETAMLTTMSQNADLPSLTWSDLGVSELLPTGTVTLLLADVEGSTRLWETQPEQMTAALAQLNRTVDKTVAAFGGCARSSRVRVTVSWRHSREHRMRWRVRWCCSGNR